VRLVYSHPYDFVQGAGAASYRAVYARWLDDLAARQAQGRLQVRPMTEFADFLLRMVRTDLTFARHGSTLRISLRNPAGLRDVTVAVPHGKYRLTDLDGVRTVHAGDWDLYTITGQTDATVLVLAVR
jgi:hypothetical protein